MLVYPFVLESHHGKHVSRIVAKQDSFLIRHCEDPHNIMNYCLLEEEEEEETLTVGDEKRN